VRQSYNGLIYFFKQEHVNHVLFGFQLHSGLLYLTMLTPAFVIFPCIIHIRKKWMIHGRNITSGEFLPIGLIMFSISFVVLSLGIVFAHGSKISELWLLLCYCFSTIGYLLVCPIAISSVFGWSPDKWKGLTMGLSFLAIGLNSYLNNEVEKFISPTLKNLTLQNYNHIFLSFAIVIFAFAVFLYLVNEIRTKLTQFLEDEKTRTQEAQFFGEVATQVAHDIRSPLLVLRYVLSDFSALPEKKRVDAKHAIERVTDIANNLLTQYKNKNADIPLSSEPVAMMLEGIVSEKRIQAAKLGIDIELISVPEIQSVFVQVDIADFKRVISNLINNAMEAVKSKKGLIIISIHNHHGKVLLNIKDNGCGIPAEKLDAVLTGTSFEKTEGSGLGLPYAVKKIMQWHGTYSLTSAVNIGTEFEIILPEIASAAWFASAIHVVTGGTVVVLDDDDYIHQIWDKRFPETFLKENRLSLFHFKTKQDFLSFCVENNTTQTTFLLDYDIGDDTDTGISLAKRLHLGKQAILVTSRYEDNRIRVNCQELQMKLIPKYFAEYIPMVVTLKKPSTTVVLVDDDKMITRIWQECAIDAGVTLDVFHHPRDFMRVLDQYQKETVIYIDSSLSDNLKGEDFAKTLYEQGYVNIILETGYEKECFLHVTWVKDVVGKEPPWG
jgi:signal transduction histidine kinase